MSVRLLLSGLRASPFLALALVGVTACGSSSDGDFIPDLPDAGVTPPDEDGGPDVPVTPQDPLDFTRAVPSSGPYDGGNLVILRGTGFDSDAEVYFGGNRVQPADVCGRGMPDCDPFRLSVRPPAGEPGQVAIRIRQGEGDDVEEITAPGAYTYEAFDVFPFQGSTAGGTRITITGLGTSFADGDEVEIAGEPCRSIEVVSPTVMTCRTPAGDAGAVDVVVIDGDTADELVANDAFTYLDTASPDAGGLGGGPVRPEGATAGTLNVTIINAGNGNREPDVFVIVGEDPDTPLQGFTDASGQIVFSSAGLEAPIAVHAVKDCFERTSFVSFDSRDVTIFLTPWNPMDPRTPPRCLPPPTPGAPPPGGPGRLGAVVGGSLRWLGANEFGLNDWDNIPEPTRGYERAAYVYTTQVCEGAAENCQNPLTQPNPLAPNESLITRVLEEDLPPSGSTGWPFAIFARPGSYAVWAIAGLEIPPVIDATTGLITEGDFIPYVMGVARNVIAGPGETVEGVEVVMDIPLDATFDVEFDGLPSSVPTGPNFYATQAYVDLGAEGFISRTPGLARTSFGFFPYLLELPDGLDIVTSRALRTFRFWAQPQLTGTLSDARYRMTSGWYTSGVGGAPYTERTETGVRDTRGTVTVDDWLAIPVAADPASPGGRLPDDRVLRWEIEGPDPDFQVVLVTGADGLPAWRMFVQGSRREAPVPDLSSIPSLRDLPSGTFSWAVFAARMPGFCPRSPDCEEGEASFNSLTYRDINTRLWSHTSANQFTATVPVQ